MRVGLSYRDNYSNIGFTYETSYNPALIAVNEY